MSKKGQKWTRAAVGMSDAEKEMHRQMMIALNKSLAHRKKQAAALKGHPNWNTNKKGVPIPRERLLKRLATIYSVKLV